MSSGLPTVKLSFANEVKGMDSTTGHSGLMSTELLYVTCCRVTVDIQQHQDSGCAAAGVRLVFSDIRIGFCCMCCICKVYNETILQSIACTSEEPH